MIERMGFVNFEAYAVENLEFVPGVNVIVGESDIGKSSLIRILRWVLLNQPAGDAMRRVGTKETSAKVVVDGEGIVRRKTKSVNEYRIGDKIHKSFGRGVPDPVDTASGGICDLNFKLQGQSHTMFTATPGQVAGELNKIARLDKIGPLIKMINSTIRDKRAEKKNYDEWVAEHDREINELSWVSAAAGCLKKIETEAHKIAAVNRTLADAVPAASDLKSALANVEHCRAAARARGSFDLIVAAIEKINDEIAQGTQISVVAMKLINAKRERAELVQFIDEGAKIVDITSRNIHAINKINDATTTLLDCIRHTANTDTERVRLKALKEQHATILADAGICPTCGAATDKGG